MRKGKHLLGVMLCFAVMIVCSVFFMGVETYAVSETSRTDYTLMDGVTESTVYVTDSTGTNLCAHVLRIQKGADASIIATTKDYYTSKSTNSSRSKKAKKWGSKSWGFKTLKDLAKDYNNSKNTDGTVIAASSGDFYNKKTLQPLGLFVAEGHLLHKAGSEPFFAVLNDGTCVIRGANGITSDVREAVGGASLLSNGVNVYGSKSAEQTREPRQGIGLCEDGTIVIINVDGRDPSSAGANLYDFAEIFRQQGCVDALNFDGGGSATFLTKRSGNKSLVYRNVKGDGFERKVTGSLLIVKNNQNAGAAITGVPTVSMTDDNTSLVMAADGTWNYKVNGGKASGFYAINGKCYLFDNEGRGISTSVKVGNVTYTFQNGLYKKASDSKAGKVIVGYCGGADGGKNLLYAYQYGNKKLKIGLNPFETIGNGKMKNWNENTTLPWYSMRSDIKDIYIGNGVTTIGNMFMYVADGKVFDGTTIPTCKLTKVRFPSSLKTIGKMAFYNKPKLKNVTIPSKVKSIGAKAFSKSGKGYLKFSCGKAPSFGSKALSGTGFSNVYVKNNSAWKKYVKAGKLKKFGYKKAVKYK